MAALLLIVAGCLLGVAAALALVVLLLAREVRLYRRTRAAYIELGKGPGS